MRAKAAIVPAHFVMWLPALARPSSCAPAAAGADDSFSRAKAIFLNAMRHCKDPCQIDAFVVIAHHDNDEGHSLSVAQSRSLESAVFLAARGAREATRATEKEEEAT
jgi:hypothetical protein